MDIDKNWIQDGSWVVDDNGTTIHRGLNDNNARLIASSPDLLRALKFLVADYVAIEGPRLTKSQFPLELALAAIAKAEGNENKPLKP